MKRILSERENMEKIVVGIKKGEDRMVRKEEQKIKIYKRKRNIERIIRKRMRSLKENK